jgi:hypothetical protein
MTTERKHEGTIAVKDRKERSKEERELRNK